MVLVVDDSAMNRKMLCKVMKAAGHTCEEAEDGEVAVRKVREKIEARGHQYDGILMDFVMPNMDGPTATKLIRDLGYTAPIFGVTGNTMDSEVDRFLASGATMVMGKPFDVDAFVQVMCENGGRDRRVMSI